MPTPAVPLSLILLCFFTCTGSSPALAAASTASPAHAGTAEAAPTFPAIVRRLHLGDVVKDFAVVDELLYWLPDMSSLISVYNLTSNASLASIDLTATVQGHGLHPLYPVSLHVAAGLLWVGEYNNNVNIVLRPDGTLVRLYTALETGLENDFVFPSPDGAFFAENTRSEQWKLYNASAKPGPGNRLAALYSVPLLGYYSNPVFARADGVDLIYWVTSSQDWRHPSMTLMGYFLSNGSVASNVSMPAGQLLLKQTTWITSLQQLSDGTFVLGGGFEDGYPKPLCYYRPHAAVRSERLLCQLDLTSAEVNLRMDRFDRLWITQVGNSSNVVVVAAPQLAAVSSSSSASWVPSSSSSSGTSPSSASAMLSSLSVASTSSGTSTEGMEWSTWWVVLVALGSLSLGVLLTLVACRCRQQRRGKEVAAARGPATSAPGSSSTGYNDLDTPMLAHVRSSSRR